MNAKLMRYYRKKMSGGRSMAARILDFAVLRILTALVLYLLMLFLSRSMTVALLVSIFLTIAISLALLLIDRRRIQKYIDKDLSRIREKCQLETLTFMSADEYARYLSKLLDGLERIKATQTGFTAVKNGIQIFAWHNHPSAKCGVEDVLPVLRAMQGQRLALITLSDFTPEAKTLCAGRGQGITLISGGQLLRMAERKGMMPDKQDAEQRAQAEMYASATTIDKVMESALNRAKVRRYMLCGMIATIWPLIAGFELYYPIIALCCYALAILAFRKGRGAHSGTGQRADL